MAEDKRARLKQWLASGEARLQPLTFPERELWEASPVPVGDVANHICCLIDIRGLLTPHASEEAVRRVVDRQEALRLSFLPGKEGPLQFIRQSAEPNIQFRELTPAEKETDATEEIARQIFREPFDLMQGPLYRAHALRRAVNDHVLVLAIHHAIADGWTLGVFVQDLCGAYVHGLMGLQGALPPVELTYTAWGAAERASWSPEELARRAEYWRTTLSGRCRIWPDPGPLREASVPQRWVSEIPAELCTAARELARRHSVTLFSALLACFQIALSDWTGVDDILVGTPVANRGKQTVRETMGYFAGIVPLRGQVDRTRPIAATLQAVHHATVEAFANAMPFAELIRALGEPCTMDRNPLFDVRFALQNHPVPEISMPTFSARLSMRGTGTARFELGCEITETGESLEVVWLSRRTIFGNAEIENLHRMFQLFWPIPAVGQRSGPPS